MKSSNPKSGIYEAETTRTLDLNGGSPACHQGGMIVLEGNGARPSHQGDGWKESEVSYTLNTTEVHAIAKPPEKCLNAWDVQSKHVQTPEGIAEAIYSGECRGGGGESYVCYGLDRASFNQGQNAKYDFSVTEEQAPTIVAKGPGGGNDNDTVGALCARDYKGVGNQYVEEGKVIIQHERRERKEGL